MTRCLSDAALIRLLAGVGTAAERAHMTACAACGDRHRRVGSELTTVRHVLLATDPPRTRAVARTRSWAVLDAGVPSLSADAPDRVADCEWLDWAATAGCDETAHVARLLDLFEAPDIEL